MSFLTVQKNAAIMPFYVFSWMCDITARHVVINDSAAAVRPPCSLLYVSVLNDIMWHVIEFRTLTSSHQNLILTTLKKIMCATKQNKTKEMLLASYFYSKIRIETKLKQLFSASYMLLGLCQMTANFDTKTAGIFIKILLLLHWILH